MQSPWFLNVEPSARVRVIQPPSLQSAEVSGSFVSSKSVGRAVEVDEVYADDIPRVVGADIDTKADGDCVGTQLLNRLQIVERRPAAASGDNTRAFDEGPRGPELAFVDIPLLPRAGADNAVLIGLEDESREPTSAGAVEVNDELVGRCRNGRARDPLRPVARARSQRRLAYSPRCGYSTFAVVVAFVVNSRAPSPPGVSESATNSTVPPGRVSAVDHPWVFVGVTTMVVCAFEL